MNLFSEDFFMYKIKENNCEQYLIVYCQLYTELDKEISVSRRYASKYTDMCVCVYVCVSLRIQLVAAISCCTRLRKMAIVLALSVVGLLDWAPLM